MPTPAELKDAKSTAAEKAVYGVPEGIRREEKPVRTIVKTGGPYFDVDVPGTQVKELIVDKVPESIAKPGLEKEAIYPAKDMDSFWREFGQNIGHQLYELEERKKQKDDPNVKQIVAFIHDDMSKGKGITGESPVWNYDYAKLVRYAKEKGLTPPEKPKAPMNLSASDWKDWFSGEGAYAEEKYQEEMASFLEKARHILAEEYKNIKSKE